MCDPMENHQATKRNEVLIYATVWMNPENIMLNEKKKTKKSYIKRFHLYPEQIQKVDQCLPGNSREKGRDTRETKKTIFLFYFFKVMRNSGIR